jgi:hypothetical protein
MLRILLKYAQLTTVLRIILNLLLHQFIFDPILPGNLTFYGTVLKSVVCTAPVREAGDEIRITLFSIPWSKETK